MLRSCLESVAHGVQTAWATALLPPLRSVLNAQGQNWIFIFAGFALELQPNCVSLFSVKASCLAGRCRYRIMPAIGITGGISTGKSAFCHCLRQIIAGAKFFDADEAARSVAEVPEVQREIREKFGDEVFLPSGDLNRERVRAIVFRDAARRRVLERILHPRIRRQWAAEAKTYHQSSEFFFADIPLLYETGGEELCDGVVVVACSRPVQLRRLMKRMSITLEEAEQMIKSQMPLEEKIARADHVVWNNGDRATLEGQARYLAALWQNQSWSKT